MIAFISSSILFSGCAHHVGYTDVALEYRPVENPEIRERTIGPFIAITSMPGPDDPNVGVRLYTENLVERESVLEHSGLTVRVPYHWSVPIVKPVLPVTAVLAAWMPARAPHDHRDSGWHAGDYLRDFVGWLNPFEAFPSGARELHGGRKVFKTVHGYEVIRSDLQPTGPALVYVYIDGIQISYITINESGEGILNLRRALSSHTPSESFELELKGAGAKGRIFIDGDVMNALFD